MASVVKTNFINTTKLSNIFFFLSAKDLDEMCFQNLQYNRVFHLKEVKNPPVGKASMLGISSFQFSRICLHFSKQTTNCQMHFGFANAQGICPSTFLRRALPSVSR